MDSLVRRTIAQASPGGLVLLHDGGGNRSRTLAALPKIISHWVGLNTVARASNPPAQKTYRSHARRGNVVWTLCVPRCWVQDEERLAMRSHAPRGNDKIADD